MEKEIVEGKIGSVGDYGLKFSGSKLVASAKASAGPVSGEMKVELDAIDVAIASIDWVCEKVPGQLDNMAGELIKAELLKLKAQA